MDRRENTAAFVRRVTVVSLAVAALLGGLLGLLWANRDALCSRRALNEAEQGRFSEALEAAEKISGAEARQEIRYQIGEAMYRSRAYAEGAALFGGMQGYRDSEDYMLLCAYAIADDLYYAGAYDAALTAFGALGSHWDSVARQKQTIYAMGLEAMEEGDHPLAVTLFLSVPDYRDSGEKALDAAQALTGNREAAEAMLASGGLTREGLQKLQPLADRRNIFRENRIAAGAGHSVVLYSDGTVAAVGDNRYGQCDVEGWRDIVQIAAGAWHTVGLRSDGTVVATGKNDSRQCEVADFRNITRIAAGDSDTYALQEKGQVVMTGYHSYDALTRAVGVREIYAGAYAAVAAMDSGAFLATHETYALKPGSQIWDVGLHTGYVLALQIDGRLISSVDIGGDWEDIVRFDAGPAAIVAVDLEGNARAHFFRASKQIDVSTVEKACQCAAGTGHFLFLLEDGSLLALGDNTYGQCDVEGLRKVS